MNTFQFLTKNSFIALFVMLCFVGCNNNITEPAMTSVPQQKEVETKKGDSRKSYCFRNEYSHEGSEDVDVLELEITTVGDAARGIYNWLPAFKDQRKGVFRGQLKDNVIKGEYSFQQEGTAQTVPIEIILQSNAVMIKAGSAELGLNQTIKKVECEE